MGPAERWVASLPGFVLGLMLLLGCSTPGPEPEFSRNTSTLQILSGLSVYADPRADRLLLKNRMEQISAMKHHLEEVYFPGTPISPLTLVIFNDQKSYSSFAHTLQSLPLRAHFDRSKGRIYIPLNAPREVWKHELAHALLTRRSPAAPFWLQEGLAHFIQRNHFVGTPDCVTLSEARPPQVHPRALDWLRQRKFATPGRGFQIRNGGSSPYFHPAIGAYFIYYLWDRRRLFPLLKAILREPGGNPASFLIGNDPGRYEEMDRDFHQWLQGDRPARRIRGC